MAKLQNISLAPSEITGVCGRLRCCLAYEHEQYAEASKGLPRRGKEAITPYGTGRVVEVRTLAGTIVVDVEGVRHVVQREDIGKTEFTTPPVTDEKWPNWLTTDTSEEGPADAGEKKPDRPVKRRSRSSRRRRSRSKKRQPDTRQAAKEQSDRAAKPTTKPRTSKSQGGSKSSRRRSRRRPKRRNRPSGRG
jgi:hypothetical protein